MLNFTPENVLPLKYPTTDPTLPAKGAKAISATCEWAEDTTFQFNLLNAQQQRDFGPLRSIWIDASENTHPITVAVNGTEQVFTVSPGSANYYAVVNLNSPVVAFTIGAQETTITRVIFLNFVPTIPMAGQLSLSGPVTVTGSVAVTNFPASFGASQVGAWNVAVNNFPATQPVSGNVSASQSGVWNVGITNASIAVTQSGVWSVAQSGVWNVGITGTVNDNLTQVGGSAISLGQKTMSASMPVVIASDQSNVPENLTQVGGSAITLGQKTSTNSLPVVIASDNVISAKGTCFGVQTNIVTGSTPQNITGTTNTVISHVVITSIGPVLAAGNVTLSVTDGSGVLRIIMTLPVATSTATSPYIVCDFQNIYIPLVNNGVAATVKLNTNLTSGSFVFGFGLTN